MTAATVILGRRGDRAFELARAMRSRTGDNCTYQELIPGRGNNILNNASPLPAEVKHADTPQKAFRGICTCFTPYKIRWLKHGYVPQMGLGGWCACFSFAPNEHEPVADGITARNRSA